MVDALWSNNEHLATGLCSPIQKIIKNDKTAKQELTTSQTTSFDSTMGQRVYASFFPVLVDMSFHIILAESVLLYFIQNNDVTRHGRNIAPCYNPLRQEAPTTVQVSQGYHMNQR